MLTFLNYIQNAPCCTIHVDRRISFYVNCFYSDFDCSASFTFSKRSLDTTKSNLHLPTKHNSTKYTLYRNLVYVSSQNIASSTTKSTSFHEIYIFTPKYYQTYVLIKITGRENAISILLNLVYQII